MIDQRDRVVVVTGASAGIGAALAERLGAKGANVVLVARRKAELDAVAARSGKGALAVVADVTRRADVERVLREAIARFGHVDAWVNNAGRGITRLPSQLTDEDVDEMVLSNVKSALYGMQVALGHFKERKSGHIVNVSSMLGRVPFTPIRSAYSASKAMLNLLSASLRTELRAAFPDIHVSVVSPGVVATDFGTSALHGGMDMRGFPGAQQATEVADVIVGVLEQPRADVYTREDARGIIAAYYSAPDMAEVEAKFPAGPPPAPRK